VDSYHKEQIEALKMVRQHIDGLSAAERQKLADRLIKYLRFRQDVDDFLTNHFSGLCTQKCYQNRLSACCSREGIITFFADVVINYIVSKGSGYNRLQAVLNKSNEGFKCVYLSDTGCLWHLKPIVCQMYLCNQSKKLVFGTSPKLQEEWEVLEQKRKRFTWPDRPVLFDELESDFIKAGFQSSLMYLHNSPGLLRLKKMQKK
jgi:hypothetical protein